MVTLHTAHWEWSERVLCLHRSLLCIYQRIYLFHYLYTHNVVRGPKPLLLHAFMPVKEYMFSTKGNAIALRESKFFFDLKVEKSAVEANLSFVIEKYALWHLWKHRTMSTFYSNDRSNRCHSNMCEIVLCACVLVYLWPACAFMWKLHWIITIMNWFGYELSNVNNCAQCAIEMQHTSV